MERKIEKKQEGKNPGKALEHISPERGKEVMLRMDRSIRLILSKFRETFRANNISADEFREGAEEKIIKILQKYDAKTDEELQRITNRTALNHAINLVKNRKRYPTSNIHVELPDKRTPRDSAERNEILDAFNEAIVRQKLDVGQEKAIRLYLQAMADNNDKIPKRKGRQYVLNGVITKIAEEMGVPVNTAGTRIYRAKAKLRRDPRLKQMFDEL